MLSKEDIYSFYKKGNVVYKGILNLIHFDSGGLMDWNNDSRLSLNSELEDHHIFPKAYLEEILSNDSDRDYIDCVANRTLVPKKLNIKISDQKPSEYLKLIKEENNGFEKTLENHLIPTELLSGDFDNDYQFFLDLRSDEIFKIIQKHVVEPINKVKENMYEEIKIDETSNVIVFGSYRGNKVEASFNPSSKKIFYKGKLFDSPSAAAIAVKAELGASPETSENGWTFWRFLENEEEKKILEFRER